MKTGGKWMKLSACFTALFLVLALVLTALPLTFAPAMAGTIAGESFEDNFDGKGIDADKWVTSGDGVGQNVLAGSLKMKDMPAQSSVITKTPVGTDGKDLIVQFDVLDYAGQGGFMIVKGMAAQNVGTPDIGDAYYQLGTDARSMKGDGTTSFDRYYQISSDTWFDANAWASVGMTVGYTYRMNFKADGTFLLQVKTIGAEDSAYIDAIISESTKFTNVGSGYFGFYFSGATPMLEIDNLIITDGDGTESFRDDFEKEGLDEEKWVASAAVSSGPAYNAAFNNVEDGVASAQPSYLITKDKLLDMGTQNVSAQISFQFTIEELKESSFVSIFGLAAASVGENEGFKIAIRETTKTVEEAPVSVIEAVAYENSTEKGTAVEVGGMADFSDVVEVGFSIVNNTADQNIVMTLNGEAVFSFEYVALNGYVAFGIEPGSYTEADAAVTGTANVSMDNLTVDFVDYTTSAAENLFNDFSSAELGDEWYFTSVGMGGTADTEPNPNGYGAFIRDGVLDFYNASDGTYFGPTAQYSNFDLSFDVTDIVYETIYDEDDMPIQSASNWIGVTMGRASLDSMYHGGDGGGAYTVFIDNNPWGGGDGEINGRAYLMRAGSGPADADITYNYKNAWSEESQARGAMTIRLRAVNGTLELFIRYADEPLSKLDTPIMVWEDVQTNGYLALCCTVPTSYKIDNFSITNLDQGANVPEAVTETGVEVNTSDVTKFLQDGADLDLSGMKVYALMSDGTRTELTSDQYTVDRGSFDASKAGTYTIKVTYGSFTPVSFDVTVLAEESGGETPPADGGCGAAAFAAGGAAVFAGAALLGLSCVLLAKRKRS